MAIHGKNAQGRIHDQCRGPLFAHSKSPAEHAGKEIWKSRQRLEPNGKFKGHGHRFTGLPNFENGPECFDGHFRTTNQGTWSSSERHLPRLGEFRHGR